MRVYRHTQVGWPVAAGAAVGAAALLWAVGRGEVAALGLIFLVVAVLPLVLFGALTVTVSDRNVEARYGVGLVRKRIDVHTVRAVNRVRNPWYYGWGIRLIPGGWLYNISGLDAVELQMTDGRRVRIGTDDPDGLAWAIRQVAPRQEGAAGAFLVSPGFSPAVWAVFALVVPVLLLVVVMIREGMKPPGVSVSTERISVRGGLFSDDDILRKDIMTMSLEPALPAMRRTNGFGFGGVVRGRVRVAGVGDAHAFVDRDFPPYLMIRTPNDTVWINFRNPERTRRLYRELGGVER